MFHGVTVFGVGLKGGGLTLICRHHAKIWSAPIPMQNNGPPYSGTVKPGRASTRKDFMKNPTSKEFVFI